MYARALDAGALNGEMPTWSLDRKRLFWVDLREPALHEFDPAAGRDGLGHAAWIGCYGLDAGDAVVASRTGLHRLDFRTGTLDFPAPPPCDPRRFLLNDGGCDPAGRFLVAPMCHALASGDLQPGAAPASADEAGEQHPPRTRALEVQQEGHSRQEQELRCCDQDGDHVGLLRPEARDLLQALERATALPRGRPASAARRRRSGRARR